ncbi:LysM receptor kinase [Quillaja saponaria]|uniref:LysM receptor kinase n=1 Tax=Quillaja saponaria TaxID=32244 RepID=A0AAD7VM34_QUISA|nr:LysM receptor kinase [Quillaja saponaria]
MIYLWFIVWICIGSSSAQQYYDPFDCFSDGIHPGSRYTCKLFQDSCKTFLIYRANQHFRTISDISSLFHINTDEVLLLNGLTSSSEILKPGKEVLVPVGCSCSGQFFQANFSYTVPESNTTFTDIACVVFEGLVKSRILAEESISQGSKLEVGSKLHIPLRCACPNNLTSIKRVKYLVTYPLIEGDNPNTWSQKFGISLEDLWEVNHLPSESTVFPKTTLLLPFKETPVIHSDISDSPPPAPGFLSTIPMEKEQQNTKPRKMYIAGPIIGFSLVFVALVACWFYMKTLRKWKSTEGFQSFTPRSSPIWSPTARSSPRSVHTGRSSGNLCLSPDLLVGIKYFLSNHSIEEIKKATNDFSEETKIGHLVYKGLVNEVEMMIKQMRFEDTRSVIDVHSKINHINIVNLHGVCYGENDFSWSYLVFELPKNGCLRDCLSNPFNPFQWHRRTQVAFDIATGLHYLHCYTFTSYAHMNVNSKNIFITANWRAKLGNIGPGPASKPSKENDGTENHKGWMAPEYLVHGLVSEKVDIFAFGVVLLELISGREKTDGKTLEDSIRFLGGEASEGGCFEQLRILWILI